MKRRTFFRSLAAASLGMHLTSTTLRGAACLDGGEAAGTGVRGAFALDGDRVRFFSAAFAKPLRVMMLADTHLFRDDERGAEYRQFSARMAGAYNQTRHYRTGATTCPEQSFEQALATAREAEVDLVALLGDIFSFPSEAAVEWALGRLEAAGLPYLYVAGNHDWHYEGMPGSSAELRATWIEQRLRPLYQGADPLMAVREVQGVRFVTIDDSCYEILPAQLEFFRAQVATGQPMVLLMHIPLYAPGRSVGYGCGHPDWGAAADRNHEIERRPRWPESGHNATTLAFHREVFDAPNLLGVFAGHIHRQSLDVVHGVPQVVVEANATGAHLDVEFVPHEV